MKSLKVFSYLTLLSLVLTMTLSSCAEDDASADIVGTWNLTALDYSGTSSVEIETETFTTQFEGMARDISASVEFKKNGTYASMGSYTIDLSYDFDGYSFDQPVPISNFIGEGTYVLDGNTMTVTEGQSGETNTITITKLEGDELEMDFMASQSSTQQGATTSFVVDGHYILEK